jgi:hypothetical protein
MYFGKDCGFQNFLLKKKIESTGIKTSAAYWKLLRGIWSSATHRKVSVRSQGRGTGDFMTHSDSCSSVCSNSTRGFISRQEDRRVSFPAADRHISFLLSRIECRMVRTTVLCVGPRFNFFSEAGYPIYSVLWLFLVHPAKDSIGHDHIFPNFRFFTCYLSVIQRYIKGTIEDIIKQKYTNFSKNLGVTPKF